MKRKYNLNHRLIACGLLISLLLQSCGDSFSRTIPQEKEQAKGTLGSRTSKDIRINPLVGQQLVASGGNLVTFYEQDGRLQADVRIDESQEEPNYRNLPVRIKKGVKLVEIAQSIPEIQQLRIQVGRNEQREPQQVCILSRGLLGGMMKKRPNKEEDGPERTKEQGAGVNIDDLNNYENLVWLAIQGDADSQFKLGLMYEQGNGVAKNYEEAIKWYQKAADQGKIIAKARLARMFYNGHGYNKDIVIANNILQRINKEIKFSAEQGDREYQFMLGWMYQNGMGIAQNYQKARKWFKKSTEHGHNEPKFKCITKAAEQENSNAQYEIGIMYELGKGVKQNYQEAVRCYQQAADQGNVIAQARLARMYHNGWGIEENIMKASEILQEVSKKIKNGAKGGNIEYQFMLGWMYVFGHGVAKDGQKAAKWYQKAAQQGHVIAQCNLGIRYEAGGGVVKDQQQAIKWYHKAAEQGYAAAQFALGKVYYLGLGWRLDYKQAYEWFRCAALQGNTNAQVTLARMYYWGKGITEDKEQAMRLCQVAGSHIQVAAEQGDIDAQWNLGWMYAKGQGVKKDKKEAFNWYYKAANRGHSSAQYNLGLMCFYGDGIDKDEEEAVRWFRKAAEQGNVDAQFSLGVRYANGQGVHKDKIKAFKWFHRAAEQGHQAAKSKIEEEEEDDDEGCIVS